MQVLYHQEEPLMNAWMMKKLQKLDLMMHLLQTQGFLRMGVGHPKPMTDLPRSKMKVHHYCFWIFFMMQLYLFLAYTRRQPCLLVISIRLKLSMKSLHHKSRMGEIVAYLNLTFHLLTNIISTLNLLMLYIITTTN